MIDRCLLILLVFASAAPAFAEEFVSPKMPPAVADFMERQHEQTLRMFKDAAEAPKTLTNPDQSPADGALPLDLALDVARAALKNCRDQGYHVAVSVVDARGSPKVAVVDDGASPRSRFENEKKLQMVFEYGRASSEAAKLLDQKFRAMGTNGLQDANNGELSGGMPLSVKGKRIGAVAVSGASGEQDENCARAALNEIGGLDTR